MATWSVSIISLGADRVQTVGKCLVMDTVGASARQISGYRSKGNGHDKLGRSQSNIRMLSIDGRVKRVRIHNSHVQIDEINT